MKNTSHDSHKPVIKLQKNYDDFILLITQTQI